MWPHSVWVFVKRMDGMRYAVYADFLSEIALTHRLKYELVPESISFKLLKV